jgi:hypothetical protein
MTVKDRVRQALTQVNGNQEFTAKDLVVEDAEVSQVQRAIRDIPYVARDNGKYRVKGRKVNNG